MSTVEKRNVIVDILRIVFALIIVAFHFFSDGADRFYGGRFGVEFFVVLSGFLFYSSWIKTAISQKESSVKIGYLKKYIKKRYWRFFWYALFAFVATFLVYRVGIKNVNTIAEISDALSGDIWEILMIKMNGFCRGEPLLNRPAWTLGCMLFAEIFILEMLTFFEKPFMAFFMPWSLIIGFGYWMNIESASVTKFLGFVTFGMLRVYLLTCVGIISFYICKRIKEITFSKEGKMVLTCCELVGFVCCILISCFRSTRNYQFCFVAILMVAIALSFSGQTYTAKLAISQDMSSFLGEYSLCIYLSHESVRRIFTTIYPDLNAMYQKWLIFLVVTLLIGLIYLLFMRAFLTVLPKIRECIKKRFILS